MAQVPPARFLLRAKDLVDARYAEPITVADSCVMVGLQSVGSFTTTFARVYGRTRPHTAHRCHPRSPEPGFRRACCSATPGLEQIPGSLRSRPPKQIPASRQHTGRRRATTTGRSVGVGVGVGVKMRIGTAQQWVHAQHVALEFWTHKVGMEVREDVSFAEATSASR